MDFENTIGSISNKIDHTLLKPDATKEEMNQLCAEAVEHGFASVCVPPYFVPHCKQQLIDSEVKICTVVGFPLGFSSSFAKVEAIKRALSDGADEIDAVVNIAAVKDANWNYVRNEIQSFTRATHLKAKMIKLIIEASMMTADQIKHICEICNAEQIDFVKTSTGFNGSATPTMIQELRSLLDKNIKIKASGGIDSPEKAKNLLSAGADRLGASKSLLLIK
jgi:deoxyribose-phosphate aldolase